MASRASTNTLERYCPSCEQSFAGIERCPDDNTQLVTLQSLADKMIGREIDGRFTIKSRLGSGGMGTVYRALQHSIGREVAIKVVTPSLVSDQVVLKRFLREAKITSRLTHPHAVSVLDFGQIEGGLFFLVMELVEGPTLAEILDREGTLTISQACRIAAQICDALDHAHGQNIIHRDLKPSNVMVLGEPGREFCKVLDFGLAKSLSSDSANTTMTASGALLGTPAYLSPEAAQGLDIQDKGDLYSLGVMLYQMVTGRLPFEATTVHQLISNHAFANAPVLTEVPEDLSSLVSQLLRKSPQDRPASAAYVRRMCERIERESAGLPRRPDPGRAPTESQSGPLAFDSTLMTPPVIGPGKPGLVTQLAAEIALANTSLAPTAPEPKKAWIPWAAVAAVAVAVVALLILKPWAGNDNAGTGVAPAASGVPPETSPGARPADPQTGTPAAVVTVPTDAGVAVGSPPIDAGTDARRDDSANTASETTSPDSDSSKSSSTKSSSTKSSSTKSSSTKSSSGKSSSGKSSSGKDSSGKDSSGKKPSDDRPPF